MEPVFDFTEVILNKIVVHNIGKRPEDEGVKLSRTEMNITDNAVEAILKQYFLSNFKSDYFFGFSHENNLDMNEVFTYSTQIFEDPDLFLDQSIHIANFLYDNSNHPKIKPGELYVCKFSNMLVHGEYVDGIGIFKSETKDTFIRVYQKNDNYEVDYDNGINIKKLDKGCLIFNSEKESGYLVSIIDTTNKTDAAYWKDDFLQVMPRENEWYQTNQLLNLCKGFSDSILTEANNVDKQDQVAFLKRTEAFFNNNENYNNEVFKQDVIGNDIISEAFEEYKNNYEMERNLQPADQFEISKPALKSGKKYFRSIIKLDKNFHIYVHSNPDYIEKGLDNTKGLKFYKLYFHDEA